MSPKPRYTRRCLAVAVVLVLVGTGCAPRAPEAAAAAVPGAVQVARSAGGTAAVPLRDAAAMRDLQGIGVEPAPTVRIAAPAGDAVVEHGDLVVKYEIDGYEVGEEFGQHVHVILDNRRHEVDYSPAGSVSFAAGELTPGTHSLTVLLSRDFHVALKNPEAADRVIFHVGEPSPEGGPESGAPTLVYSWPNGSFARNDGSASNIMLDFYLFNVQLGAGDCRVRATVDGGPALLIEDWTPRIILTDPAPGEHTVRLELLDADGNPVPGPLNDTTRTIIVTE